MEDVIFGIVFGFLCLLYIVACFVEKFVESVEDIDLDAEEDIIKTNHIKEENNEIS